MVHLLTEQQIAWFSLNLDPLQTMVLEPLHALICVSVPLPRPRRNPFLPAAQLIMKLLAEEMGTLADDEAAVIWSVRKKVNQALEATESRNLGVLVLVRPRAIGRKIFTVDKAVVHSVERD